MRLNKWESTSIKEINFRKSKNINPSDFPDELFELYSVPIFKERRPEVVQGSEVGSTKQIVEEDEILICKINPRINRVWKVGNYTNNRKIASSEWIVVNTKGFSNPDFLEYLFSAPFFRELLTSEVSGVGGSLTRARPRLVENYRFPMAPINEQTRIACKIDQLFSHLDKLKARLETIPEELKQFRQAILKQAVCGKLTEEWRKKNPNESVISLLSSIENRREKIIEKRDNKIPKYENFETFGIPKNWSWTRLWNLSYLVTSGSRDWSKFYSNKGAYFVRSAEINNNKLRLKEAILVQLPEKVEGKRSLIEKGNLLTTITGANVGKCAKVTSKIPESYVSQSVALIKLVDIETTDYIHLSLLSPNAGGKMLDEMAYGMGRPVLNLQQIKSILIPLPPKNEQKVIVERVENLLSKAENIETHYNVLKNQIDDLPQTILAKAFRGELVEQDPEDEPAEVLLKRIKELKESFSKKK